MLAVFQVDSVQRSAMSTLAQFGVDLAMVDRVKSRNGLGSSQELANQNEAAIEAILDQLAAHNSPAAVQVIQRTFKSKLLPYRSLALRALAQMSIPEARRAIVKRKSWFSSASPEEKRLAEQLLDLKS